MILTKIRAGAVSLLFACIAAPVQARDSSLSFIQWRSNIEEAFKVLQSQEDKFLSPETAKMFVPWSHELGTAARPDETVMANENPSAVNAVETCRKALMLGAALWLKAKNVLLDDPSPIGLNGDEPFAHFA